MRLLLAFLIVLALAVPVVSQVTITNGSGTNTGVYLGDRRVDMRFTVPSGADGMSIDSISFGVYNINVACNPVTTWWALYEVASGSPDYPGDLVADADDSCEWDDTGVPGGKRCTSAWSSHTLTGETDYYLTMHNDCCEGSQFTGQYDWEGSTDISWFHWYTPMNCDSAGEAWPATAPSSTGNQHRVIYFAIWASDHSGGGGSAVIVSGAHVRPVHVQPVSGGASE